MQPTTKTGRAMAAILAETLVCKDCGKEAKRTGQRQFFCVQCSDRRSLERKSKWAKFHPQRPEIYKKHGARKRSRMLEVGAVSSEANRSNIGDLFKGDHALLWTRRIAVPFSYALSKNHIFQLSDLGHVALRQESKDHRSLLSEAVRSAVADVKPVEAKVWIDLIVEKPNHRGDAVNVLNLVFDGIKDAIGVDDRWFSIHRLDWHIVKNAPNILIGIGQEVDTHHQVCSYCGRVLPYAAFDANKGMRNGITRACKECKAASRRKRPLKTHA